MGLAGDNFTIANSCIQAQCGIINDRVFGWANRGAILNATVNNCTFRNKSDSSYIINFDYQNLEPVHGFKVSNTTFDMRQKSSCCLNSNSRNDELFMKDFILKDIQVLMNTIDKQTSQPFTFTRTNTLIIDNMKVIDDGLKQVYRILVINDCENVNLDNLYLEPSASNTCISCSGDKNVKISNIIANENSKYYINLSDTDSILNVSNTILNKTICNDIYSVQNKNIIKTIVICPSSRRPESPIQGDSCYDTSINKPIWWDGSNWIDATGTVV